MTDQPSPTPQNAQPDGLAQAAGNAIAGPTGKMSDELGNAIANLKQQVDSAFKTSFTVAGIPLPAVTVPDLRLQLPSFKLPRLDFISDQLRETFAHLHLETQRILDGFASSAAKMTPKVGIALIELGRHGWYLDMTMGFDELSHLEKMLTSSKVAEAETVLERHYEDSLDDIEAMLREAHPNRAKILSAALKAHRSGDYELSVPALLIQADGICVDRTKLHLFQKGRGAGKDKVPEVASFVDDLVNKDFLTALLGPLTISLPINASEKERERMMAAENLEDWRQLNRHQVLHGESVEYGTKTNSLKAISLVTYLAGVLRHTREKNPSPP